LPALTAGWGREAHLVLGSRALEAAGIVARLESLLAPSGVTLSVLARIDHEPEPADVDRAATSLRGRDLSRAWILALGGGSALDLGKAVAAMAPQPEAAPVADYLEGVGRGLKLAVAPLPLVAVPTTAGTGAEATKNAVISSRRPPYKKSLRDERMIPRLALVDPELTLTCPRPTTIRSGLDAITQLLESFISSRARPVPQALAVDGLRRALPAFARLLDAPHDAPARAAMAHAALLSGLALANSGLGLAHGVAAGLGCLVGAPHGLACAVMLPAALQANREAAAPSLARLARDLAFSSADALLDHVEALVRAAGVPRRLSELGLAADQLPELVRLSHGNSLDGNPRRFTDDELLALLQSIQ
jgi:alcohol dehydrogenase class IV